MAGRICGEGALALAGLAAIEFAQGRSGDELGFWAAFFTILGDNLALLALSAPSEEGSSGE